MEKQDRGVSTNLGQNNWSRLTLFWFLKLPFSEHSSFIMDSSKAGWLSAIEDIFSENMELGNTLFHRNPAALLQGR